MMWIIEYIAILLTLCVCFYCVWLCVPVLFSEMFLTQKLMIIAGYVIICYLCGKLFESLAKNLRNKK